MRMMDLRRVMMIEGREGLRGSYMGRGRCTGEGLSLGFLFFVFMFFFSSFFLNLSLFPLLLFAFVLLCPFRAYLYIFSFPFS